MKTTTATKTGTRSLKSRVKGGRRRRRRGVREAPVEEEEEERDGGACDGVSSRDAYGGDTHRIAGLSRDHPGPEPAEEPRLLHRWRFLDRRLRAPHVHAAHAAHPARRRQGKGAYFLCFKVTRSQPCRRISPLFFSFFFFLFFCRSITCSRKGWLVREFRILKLFVRFSLEILLEFRLTSNWGVRDKLGRNVFENVFLFFFFFILFHNSNF